MYESVAVGLPGTNESAPSSETRAITGISGKIIRGAYALSTPLLK